MRRIYLDWNIISNLKPPVGIEPNPTFAALRKYLEDRADAFIIPFSHPHFKDSEKSHVNPLFLQDLDTMTVLCQDQFMYFEDGTSYTRSMSPREALSLYRPELGDDGEPFDIQKVLEEMDKNFADKGYPQIGSSVQALWSMPLHFDENWPSVLKVLFPDLKKGSTILDLIKGMGPIADDPTNKSRWIEMRASIEADGASIKNATTNVTLETAVQRIDVFVKEKLNFPTYRAFIDDGLKHEKQKPDELKWFQQAYQMLDLLGYKPDTLSKPGVSVRNIYHDAEHAFFAQFCDFLITDDKNLKAKAAVLYRLLGVTTEVVGSANAITRIEKTIKPTPQSPEDFIDQVVAEYVNGNEVPPELIEVGPESVVIARKARLPIFDFFTHVICHTSSKQGAVLQIRHVVVDQPRFSYAKEIRHVLRAIIIALGEERIDDIDACVKDLMQSEDPSPIHWLSSHYVITLAMETELDRPTIYLYLFHEPIKTEDLQTSTGAPLRDPAT